MKAGNFSIPFETKNGPYTLHYVDGEFIIGMDAPPYDPFAEPYSTRPTTILHQTKDGFSGMDVYRKAVRICINEIHERGITWFSYTTGFEEKRSRLYTFFIRIAEKHGYSCIWNDGSKFYFAKKKPTA